MKRRLPMSPGRRTKLQTRPEFKVDSYIGTDIAQLREDGERPPRSAKFVASFNMLSPPSDDYRVYLLSTNRERSLWILWLRGDDGENGRPQYCRIATSRPYRGYSARFAAEQLLIKSWQDERDKWGIGAPWALPMSEGLLTEEDINRIKLVVFGES